MSQRTPKSGLRCFGDSPESCFVCLRRHRNLDFGILPLQSICSTDFIVFRSFSHILSNCNLESNDKPPKSGFWRSVIELELSIKLEDSVFASLTRGSIRLHGFQFISWTSKIFLVFMCSQTLKSRLQSWGAQIYTLHHRQAHSHTTARQCSVYLCALTSAHIYTPHRR